MTFGSCLVYFVYFMIFVFVLRCIFNVFNKEETIEPKEISELGKKVKNYIHMHYSSPAMFEMSDEDYSVREQKKVQKVAENMETYVRKKYIDIGEKIVRFIEARGDNYIDVYKTAEISPQLWHKYMSGESKPGKDNMFRMAVVMDLNLVDARQFLNLAGFSFSDCSRRDLAMEYFFANGVSDYKDINSCLTELGMEPLFSK